MAVLILLIELARFIGNHRCIVDLREHRSHREHRQEERDPHENTSRGKLNDSHRLPQEREHDDDPRERGRGQENRGRERQRREENRDLDRVDIAPFARVELQ